MGMNYVRLYCKSDSDQLPLDQHGAWCHLLELAGLTASKGDIFVIPGVGFTNSQLAHKFICKPQKVAALLRLFIGLGRIVVHPDKTITIVNWGRYQSEYDRTKCYRNATTDATENATPDATPQSIEYRREVEEEDNYSNILSFWNEQEIIKHKTLASNARRVLTTLLKTYTVFEICEAIKVYGEVLNSEDYRWTYRWTLADFLAKGFDKFTDADASRKNYRVKDAPRQAAPPDPNDPAAFQRYAHLGEREYNFRCTAEGCDYTEARSHRGQMSKQAQECPECHQQSFVWEASDG